MKDAPVAPAISVLIPSWNARGVIGRALDSVLSERRVAIEVIVVDDGSTDGTAEAVREIAARDSRVVLVALDTNGGVSNARNQGLERVRGEWLALLDADDRFLPGGLAMLHAAAVARDALAVIGQQVWSDGRHQWIGPLYDRPDIRRPGRKSLAAAPGLLYYVSPHGKLFHRSIWMGLSFQGRVLGDQPWVIRALLRAGDRIEVLGDTVYEWIRTSQPGSGPSITASTRASAARGVEAAGVAAGAVASVAAEIDRTVADREAARRLASAYAERLLESDLAVHLARALDRADPDMGLLFSAIGAFVAALPAGTLQSSRALADLVVLPPLRRWDRVAPPARAAFSGLVAAARAAQPDLTDRPSSPLDRWALRRVLTGIVPDPDAASAAMLALAGAVATLRSAPRLAGAARRRLRLP